MDRFRSDVYRVIQRFKKNGGTLDVSLEKSADDALPALIKTMPDKTLEIGDEAIQRALKKPALEKIVKLVMAACIKQDDREMIRFRFNQAKKKQSAMSIEVMNP